MYNLNACRTVALALATWGRQRSTKIVRSVTRPPCDITPYPPFKKQCFDINKVTVERGNQCHSNMIRLFMYNHYWPREPSVVSLWMCFDSPYLDILTDKYSKSGDRFLAFEEIDRTRESKLIGVTVAYKLFPWMVDELEEWAHYTHSKPDRTRMYFMAYCLKCADLIKKYNVDFIYDEKANEQEIHLVISDHCRPWTFATSIWIEVLGTDAELAGRGVGKLLLEAALKHADDLGYPLAQVIAVNHYASKICTKCGMKLEWSMNYDEYVDRTGHQVFFPRRPHTVVYVYSKFFEPSKPKPVPCKPPFL